MVGAHCDLAPFCGSSTKNGRAMTTNYDCALMSVNLRGAAPYSPLPPTASAQRKARAVSIVASTSFTSLQLRTIRTKNALRAFLRRQIK